MNRETSKVTTSRTPHVIQKSNGRHWVGNGFYVSGLLRPVPQLNHLISPFILLDYAAPKTFTATETRRGVGEHPHRGFETVTFAFQGEVEHRDSSGGGGVIKAGDVQWMTAASGVVHDEFHSQAFSKAGGTFEMVQLWVNLPSKDKMSSPRYQEIGANRIPTIKLSESLHMRLVAGQFQGETGPAMTHSAMNVYDVSASAEGSQHIDLPSSHNAILLVRQGQVSIGEHKVAGDSLIIFNHDGDGVTLEYSADCQCLMLSGEPLNEPVAAHGPFVMNTREEIIQAFEDFQNGKMGRLPPTSG